MLQLIPSCVAASIGRIQSNWRDSARQATVIVSGYSKIADGTGVHTVKTSGIGFAVEDGTIIAASAGAVGDDRTVVLIGSREVKADLVQFDDDSGIVLLKVTKPLRNTVVVSTEKIHEGEPVLMMGRKKLESKIVPSSGAVVSYPLPEAKSMFMFSGSASSLTEGAPIFNAHGRLIGIETAGRGGTGQGFALTADLLTRALRTERIYRKELAGTRFGLDRSPVIFRSENTPELKAAVESNNPELIKRLINERPKEALRFRIFTETLMHTAARMGSKDIAKLLLKAGMDIDAEGPRSESTLGFTPLQVAASAGQIGMVEFFCQHGARLTSSDKNFLNLHSLPQEVTGIIEKYRSSKATHK